MYEVDRWGRWHVHTSKVILVGNKLVKVCEYCGKRMD